MATAGLVMLVAGIALALAGLVFLLLARFGVTRLPGDVVVQRDNFILSAPIGLMIVLSIVLTIVLNFSLRR